MFETTKVRHCCILRPFSFTLVYKRQKREQYSTKLDTVNSITKIEVISYTDDMELITKDEKSLNKSLKVFSEELESRSMRIKVRQNNEHKKKYYEALY